MSAPPDKLIDQFTLYEAPDIAGDLRDATICLKYTRIRMAMEAGTMAIGYTLSAIGDNLSGHNWAPFAGFTGRVLLILGAVGVTIDDNAYTNAKRRYDDAAQMYKDQCN